MLEIFESCIGYCSSGHKGLTTLLYMVPNKEVYIFNNSTCQDGATYSISIR